MLVRKRGNHTCGDTIRSRVGVLKKRSRKTPDGAIGTKASLEPESIVGPERGFSDLADRKGQGETATKSKKETPTRSTV